MYFDGALNINGAGAGILFITPTKDKLRYILRNKEANGYIIKWAIELDTYSIEFRSRPTIKSQALADFIAEWTEIQEPIAPLAPSTG